MFGHRQRAAAQAALVAAAVEQRFEPDVRLAAADVQGADALGAVHLVGRQAEQVDAHVVHVERDFARRLHRVGVEQHAASLAQPADVADRLERADLIIRGHHADQERPLGDRRLHLLRRDPPVAIHRQDRHAEAVAFQPPQRVEHGVMLRGDRDQVVALLSVGRGHALEGEIVALGGAAGEDDRPRLGPDQAGDLLAGLVHRLLGLLTEGVLPAGGVAVVFGEVWQHGLQHARIDARRGMVVQINGELHHSRPSGPASGASNLCSFYPMCEVGTVRVGKKKGANEPRPLGSGAKTAP